MHNGPTNVEVPPTAPSFRSSGAGLCLAACALTAATLACFGQEVPRHNGLAGSVAEAAVLAMPMAAITFAAAPAVTSPTETVSRFALEPLPLIANLVSVRLLDEILLSRLGGRHGP